MNHFSVILLLVLSVAGITSCEKEKDRNWEQIRMFMPGNINVSSAATQVTLTWSPSLFTEGRAVSYTVQVARDSSFTNLEFTRVVDTPKVVITDTSLVVRQRYVARVKANTTGDVPESKWVISAPFTIQGEQIFLTIQPTDIIDNAVMLKWRSTPGLTKITLRPTGGNAFDVALSAGDVTAMQKLVSGLTPNTLYEAEIFAGTRSLGFTTFRTKAPVAGASIIDLRGIAGRPNVLVDTLPVIPANSIVILERGLTYTVASALSLSKGVTILSGDDLLNPNLATIFFTSNFNFAAGSVIDSIKFSGVNLRSDNYTSRYIFNTTGAATVGKMIFENCRAEIFRGMVRLQSGATTVNEFRVTNCILDSLSNYGVLTVDNVSCKAENIIIQRSTIYKAEKIITSRQISNTVLLEDLTVNEAPWGGAANYVIDYSQSATNTVTGGITIRNCVFGQGKWNAGNTNVRDIRTNAATGITASNNYKTSDRIVAGNEIPGMITYAGTSFQLWRNPTAGDFTIIGAGFPNNVGDPRWR